MNTPPGTMRFAPVISRRQQAVVCSIVLAVLATACVAQAAPKSAYAVQARSDRADAKYAVGDTVVFTVECLADGQPVTEATLAYALRENDFKELAKGSVAITNGRGAIEHTWTTPGFLLLAITQPGVKKPVLVGAACEPEKLQPSMPKPDDFDAFWEGMKAKVDSIAADPVLTPVPHLTDDAIETYTLTMENFNGTKVRCYFSKPRGNGPFPAFMELHGAGTIFIEPDLVAAYARRGVMAIDMCPHDVELGRPEATYRELWNSTLKGYPRRGSDSRDTSYFLQMFCGNYRTARYITSRPEWNRSHFVVHGSSQGGGQCLATAYLCPQVTALAANIAALCDHTGPVVGRAAGWPKWITSTDGTPDPDQLTSARYFDGVNFAQSIKAKALISMGFIDQVCPPSSVYTAFNAYKGPKQVLEKPLIAHQLSPPWREVSQKFIDQELGLPVP
jgi:cephalosporin-C deacetylase